MADLEKLRRNLESHGFGYRYFETPEEAADYLCASLHGRTVGIGGSITVEELGVYPRLAEDNQVFWHWKQDPAQARAQAGAAEVYLCSANGVSETGEIVNIDGTGNRLAASMYGKKKVYIIIGVNKVEPTPGAGHPAGAGRGGAAELPPLRLADALRAGGGATVF